MQSGNVPGMELGAVQGGIDWEKSSGLKLQVGSGLVKGIRLTKLKSQRQSKEDLDAAGCRRIWAAGEELVVSYDPHVGVDLDFSGDGVGASPAAEAPPPETARPGRERKRSRSDSDPYDETEPDRFGRRRTFDEDERAEEPERDRFGRRRTTDADYRIPRMNVPRDSHEAFHVGDSDED